MVIAGLGNQQRIERLMAGAHATSKCSGQLRDEQIKHIVGCQHRPGALLQTLSTFALCAAREQTVLKVTGVRNALGGQAKWMSKSALRHHKLRKVSTFT